MMSGMIFASRVTGLLRQVLIAHLFRTDWRMDAYASAFSLPDFIFFLISGGALATGFVPVFTEYVTKGQRDQAVRTFRALGTFLAVTLLVIIGACWVLAPQLIWVIFPGYHHNTPKIPDAVRTRELTIALTRILLPAQFFFVLGGLFQGTLNSLRYFFITAWQPIIYNVGIMVGGAISYKYGGPHAVEGLAIGALCGAFIGAFIVQVPALLYVGMSFRPKWDLHDPGVRKVATLVAPVILGLSIQQINAIILPRSIASMLGSGSTMIIEYSNRLMQVPVAIFASGMAIALLPTLSALAAEGKIAELRERLSLSLRTELMLALPSAVLLFVLAKPIVRLFYQHGAFTATQTDRVAYALLFYCPGIIGMSAQQIVSRGFYALQDTISVVVLGLIGFASYFVAAFFFLRVVPLDLGAPAAATSVAALLNGTLLLAALGRRIGAVEDRESLVSLGKCAVAAAAMGGAVFAIVVGWENAIGVGSKSVQLTEVALALATAGIVYAAALRALQVNEAALIWQRLRNRFKRG